jgi:hypothetical protein
MHQRDDRLTVEKPFPYVVAGSVERRTTVGGRRCREYVAKNCEGRVV